MPANSLIVQVEWDAAHFLPKYKGKCQQLHGHRWVLEVVISGVTNPETGFIVDFKKIKDILQEQVVDIYDHQLINDFLEEPTAENIVEDVASRIKTTLNKKSLPVTLSGLRLWETPNSSCIWKP